MGYSIAIHGGAGTILPSSMTPEKEAAYRKGLEQAILEGSKILKERGSALDAVEKAVVVLEDNPLFNAGKGSVFNSEGTHDMDASIMNGSNLEAGAITQVSGIRNPIYLARLVMEKSGHVFLSGIGAMKFATQHGCKTEDENYFYDELRYNQWMEVKDTDSFQLDHSESKKEDKFGTVGAVALDEQGNVAAATSTGGMTNKRFGRIGDSPIIGSGNYANNKTCGVSCTGSGEFFIRGVVAYDVSCLMEYKGLSLEEACNMVVHDRLMKINGDGGLVAVDSLGNVAMPFNTPGMYRASQINSDQMFVGIYKN
jgi:beta-aspartyl-peptidase (threonine type)